MAGGSLLEKGNDCINSSLGSLGDAPMEEPPPVGMLPARQSPLDSTTFPGGTVTTGPCFVTINRDCPGIRGMTPARNAADN